jgi:CHAD domain-containing protein
MHLRLIETSKQADEAAAELRSGYTVEALYSFRVAARRIRSLLKQLDNHRSRVLRKAWGGYAAVTGPARDWDVFKISAEKLLSAVEFEHFQDINQKRITSSHDAVLEMLFSAPWRRHMAEWQHFLEQAEEHAEGVDRQEQSQRTLDRAAVALQTALTIDDDHHWHRFRIAVKEVRYVAEASPDDPAAQKLVEECKEVQSILGAWHDAVVQLTMLAELPPADVHETLRSRVTQTKHEKLAQIRDEAANHPLFSRPDAPGRAEAPTA